MEKCGVIKAGVTPPEHEDAQQPTEKKAQVRALDSDFRKRVADTVQTTTK
jgi:hypothetical protein